MTRMKGLSLYYRFIFITIGLGILFILLTFGLSSYYKNESSFLTVCFTLILCCIGIVISAIAEIYFTIQDSKELHSIEIYKEDALIDEFKKMKLTANSACKLIWCGKYTENEVKKYFKEENDFLLERKKGNKELRIERIISDKLDKKLVELHDNLMEDARKENLYSYKISNICGIEIVTNDFWNNGERSYFSMLVLLDENGHPTYGIKFDDPENIRHNSITKTLGTIWKNFWDMGEDPKPRDSTSAIEPEKSIGSLIPTPSISGLDNSIGSNNGSYRTGITKKKYNIWDSIAEIYDDYVSNLFSGKNNLLDIYEEGEEKLIFNLINKILETGSVSIIEVGCGTGRGLIKIAKKYSHPSVAGFFEISNLVGVDSSRVMSQKSKDKFADLISNSEIDSRWEKNINIIIGDALKLKFLLTRKRIKITNTVPIVICLLNTMGIIHTQEERIKLINEMARVAGSNGKLFISVFNAEKFESNAYDVYSSLEKVVGVLSDTGPIDSKLHDFYNKSSGYYAHWFLDKEIEDIVLKGLINSPLSGSIPEKYFIEEIGIIIIV